jgi:hypothetical protein
MLDRADDVPILAALGPIALDGPFSHQREAARWAVRWHDWDAVVRRLDQAFRPMAVRCSAPQPRLLDVFHRNRPPLSRYSAR